MHDADDVPDGGGVGWSRLGGGRLAVEGRWGQGGGFVAIGAQSHSCLLSVSSAAAMATGIGPDPNSHSLVLVGPSALVLAPVELLS